MTVDVFVCVCVCVCMCVCVCVCVWISLTLHCFFSQQDFEPKKTETSQPLLRKRLASDKLYSALNLLSLSLSFTHIHTLCDGCTQSYLLNLLNCHCILLPSNFILLSHALPLYVWLDMFKNNVTVSLNSKNKNCLCSSSFVGVLDNSIC